VLQIVLLLWTLGVALVLSRLAFGTLRMWCITRDAECLTAYHWSAMTTRLRGQLDLRWHIPLYASDEISMPVTWGVWQPVIVLPAESSEWSAEWRRIVLLHELAHIKRRDCLTQMLANLACALYWFNPLVRFAARRLRVEREWACEDCVLETGTRASDYARYLVEIAQSFDVAEPATPVAVGMACSQLESRSNPAYFTAMRNLSYDDIKSERMFSLALHDVSTRFVQETKSWGFDKLPLDKLISFRIFKVDDLIKLRIHGVDSAYIKKMKGIQ
jgi:beta-lactamase regulating signal transducer with metallopeptidase domain